MTTIPLEGTRSTLEIRAGAGATALSEWEWRLVLKARLLRQEQKASMMLVKFDGPAMTLWRLTPDGRVGE